MTCLNWLKCFRRSKLLRMNTLLYRWLGVLTINIFFTFYCFDIKSIILRICIVIWSIRFIWICLLYFCGFGNFYCFIWNWFISYLVFLNYHNFVIFEQFLSFDQFYSSDFYLCLRFNHLSRGISRFACSSCI